MSIFFLYKMLGWIGANVSEPPVHSYFAVLSNIICNVVLTRLNIHWAGKMLKRALRPENKGDQLSKKLADKTD